ncbi:hypothetical protein [Kribbella sp. CA-293567]|uniref:hypothetical protein n=1 Tax=Kribbella sp. CA-293567 TaxID=3002436 RepID=UPI0022DE214E|nr:hypothetical protein [Kribbella sp. CA-293567]WBQ07070.1 hypothetical protein OX958_09775 [Kribbella sp. CA-293567]
MPDPVTLAVLGGLAATEGIKFLYGQAGELLKAWRERRKDEELEVPIAPAEILDGTPGPATVDVAVLAARHLELVKLAGALSPYAQGLAEIDLGDPELAEQAGQLRGLLEAAYGQRFTFRGESRESTGTRVSIRQVLGEVAGEVVGVQGTAGSDATVVVDQQADQVTAEGSVTGFKGDLGR